MKNLLDIWVGITFALESLTGFFVILVLGYFCIIEWITGPLKATKDWDLDAVAEKFNKSDLVSSATDLLTADLDATDEEKEKLAVQTMLNFSKNVSIWNINLDFCVFLYTPILCLGFLCAIYYKIDFWSVAAALLTIWYFSYFYKQRIRIKKLREIFSVPVSEWKSLLVQLNSKYTDA